MNALCMNAKHTRSPTYRSAAPPPQSCDIPPEAEDPLPRDMARLRPGSSSTLRPSWALDAIRFSTLCGAFTLAPSDLKLLKKVPRDPPDDGGAEPADRRVTRTQSLILAGQRIDFAFCTGSKALKHHGLPMYALMNATQEELYVNMSAAGARVMEPFGLRQVRIRIVWPLPLSNGSEPSQVVYEEWLRVFLTHTRVEIGMAVARVFYNFVEKHRTTLATHPDYPWSLRLDAFYRVWLLGLERVENNVFVADLKYVKCYPNDREL